VRIDDVIDGKYDDVVPVVGTPATASATEGATR